MKRIAALLPHVLGAFSLTLLCLGTILGISHEASAQSLANCDGATPAGKTACVSDGTTCDRDAAGKNCNTSAACTCTSTTQNPCGCKSS